MGKQARRVRRMANGGQVAADRRLLRGLELAGITCPECGRPIRWRIENDDDAHGDHVARRVEVLHA